MREAPSTPHLLPVDSGAPPRTRSSSFFGTRHQLSAASRAPSSSGLAHAQLPAPLCRPGPPQTPGPGTPARPGPRGPASGCREPLPPGLTSFGRDPEQSSAHRQQQQRHLPHPRSGCSLRAQQLAFRAGGRSGSPAATGPRPAERKTGAGTREDKVPAQDGSPSVLRVAPTEPTLQLGTRERSQHLSLPGRAGAPRKVVGPGLAGTALGSVWPARQR